MRTFLHITIYVWAILVACGWVRHAQAQTNPPVPSEVSRSAPNTPAPVKVCAIPFTSQKWHGGPVVHLRLNDKIDADFLVDTGANYNFIRPRIVKALGLSTIPLPKAVINPLAPSGTPTEYVSMKTVGSSAIMFDDMQFMVSDYGSDFEAGKPINGIIGKNTLQLFAVLFDFENNQILLMPGGKLSDTQLAYLKMNGGTAAGIPLGTDIQRGLPTTAPAQVKVNKHTATFPFVVDTGSLLTLVYDPKNAMQLPKTIQTIPQTKTVIGRPWNYRVFPVASLAAGERATDEKQNRLVPFECGLTLDAGNFSILGLDYLSHFRVLIDYPAERMYLMPVTNPKQHPFPTESSRQCAVLALADLFLSPSAEGKYTVLQTAPSYLFGKAGVQGGDVLETVNGKKPDGLLLYAMVALFLKSGDRPAVLQLRRDGKIVQVSVDILPKP